MWSSSLSSRGVGTRFCASRGWTELFGPHGRFAGQTKDLADLSKWDDFGLTRAEQDAKIREMLDRQRITEPGFLPNSWSWFTAGSAELADAKGRKLDAGRQQPHCAAPLSDPGPRRSASR